MMYRLIMVAVALLIAMPISSQADEKTPEAAAVSDSAMMAEWMKYATPGPEHRQLAKHVGKWTYAMKMWMDPSAPATESNGTCETSEMLGGRYIRTEYHGDFQGMPFEGVATTGYNIYSKRYEESWTDNMSTVMITSTGTSNADGSEMTCSGAFDCPMTKQMRKFRQVKKWTGPDTFTMTWYETVGDGPENKTMEFAYTRVK